MAATPNAARDGKRIIILRIKNVSPDFPFTNNIRDPGLKSWAEGFVENITKEMAVIFNLSFLLFLWHFWQNNLNEYAILSENYSDWLILMACQFVLGYLMLWGQRITFIICSYWYFFVLLLKINSYTRFCQISIFF